MHLPDGIASMPIVIIGGLAAGAGIAYGLRTLANEDIPKTAVLTAAFFISSLIHIPIPPASVHLLLPGLMGMLLGWSVFPAMFTGLLLQYLMFGHGGITTLGINTVVLATPGVLCHVLFNRSVQLSRKSAFNCGFLAGGLGVIVACLLFTASLFFSGKEFASITTVCVIAHLPVALIEGLVTASALSFIYQVRPQALHTRAPSVEPVVEGVVL